MAIDLTAGLDPATDYMLAEKPADPDFRESASMWIFDQRGEIALPRCGIESIASSWDTRDIQVNLAFPDGRVVTAREPGAGASPVDDDGISRTLRAGALEFRCVEPFARWTMSFDGKALDTTAEAMKRSEWRDAHRVELQVEVDVTTAVPPWVPGAFVEEARALLEGQEGLFISPRYEQLCTARGTVKLGNDEWSFDGSALRVHRQGVRNVEGFWGHCWQSALFPDGRGFGYLTFPPRPDGKPSFNEGFLFDGERMIPAQAVGVPWLKRLITSGEDVSLVLRTVDGDVRIEGETVFTTFTAGGTNPEFDPTLFQGGARYRWDGGETYGMIERSTPTSQLEG
ncbi:MAG: hypothetical protein E6G60_07555 [Actinobacteria bacterium]|nr:MAG: hypothetical protein E6G60_07555 [Actinomycetota bacterium]